MPELKNQNTNKTMPTAKDKGSDFTPAPAGSHLARCISVISLGTQPSEIYDDTFKVMLAWELPNETIAVNGESKPMVISKDYTLSLNKKAKLREHLEAWRGKAFTAEELQGFAVEKVLGQPCLLNIVHKVSGNGKTYANVAGVSGVPKGMTCPEQTHKSIHYEIEQRENETYKSLPEWVRKKIDQCREWNGGLEEPAGEVGTSYHETEDGDSVPF